MTLNELLEDTNLFTEVGGNHDLPVVVWINGFPVPVVGIEPSENGWEIVVRDYVGER